MRLLLADKDNLYIDYNESGKLKYKKSNYQNSSLKAYLVE